MPAPACPACDRPSDPRHAPFCSPGCRDRDLLRWLGEEYRIPVRSVDHGGVDSGDDHD